MIRHAVFAATEKQWQNFKYYMRRDAPGHEYTRIQTEYDLCGLKFEKVVLLHGAIPRDTSTSKSSTGYAHN
jgi:hypothetical protein